MERTEQRKSQPSARRRFRFVVTACVAVAACVVAAACTATGPGPPAFVGAPHTPVPVGDPAPPRHPYMAATVANNMHGDSYASDTHAAAGPLGRATEVQPAVYGALCAAQAFDSHGRLATVCGSLAGFSLKLVDPSTMAVLDSVTLPQRPSTAQAFFTGDLSKIFLDTSGGAYFYLDHRDRVVLVDADQRLRVIAIDDSGPSPRLVDEASYPLVSYLAERDCFSFPDNFAPVGRCDAITSVMPDWDGNYWWVSRYGTVGTVDPATGQVRTLQLPGEEIQNSFATAPDGVYIVSDTAMYGFRRAADGRPEVVWREPYQRSTGPRTGQVNLGSGTTPTLLGDDLVAITDGADPINVLFVDRRPSVVGDRTLCAEPVFEAGASATDNSLIGWGTSVIAENNSGYENLTSLVGGRSVVGGVTRVDYDPSDRTCHTVWESPVRSPSVVPKLSRAAGLAYFYAKEPQASGLDTWYWTAVDIRTGVIAYQVLAGTGPNFDNNWGAISIGPDGSGYVATYDGLVRVRDP